MENTYNLNAIYRLSSKGNEDALMVSIFRGMASFVMFKKGDKRPAVKVPISLAACIRIADYLDKLKDAQPETRLPFVHQSYNRDSRTFEQEAALIFFKDERKCCGIELSSKTLTEPVRVYFKCPSTFSAGNEQMSDEQKSLLGMREFKMILLQQIPMASLLSRFNMPSAPSGGGFQRNGGGQGGGNFQRSNGGGSRDPYNGGGSSGGSEEESIFG